MAVVASPPMRSNSHLESTHVCSRSAVGRMASRRVPFAPVFRCEVLAMQLVGGAWPAAAPGLPVNPVAYHHLQLRERAGRQGGNTEQIGPHLHAAWIPC